MIGLLTMPMMLGGGGWTPAQAGSLAWFDFTTPGTLWQDTNATTAVTANNDPVARANDQSGNAKHLLLTGNSDERPLWSAADGLTFDGVNDGLEISSLAIGANQLTVGIELNCTVTGVTYAVLEHGYANNASSGLNGSMICYVAAAANAGERVVRISQDTDGQGSDGLRGERFVSTDSAFRSLVMLGDNSTSIGDLRFWDEDDERTGTIVFNTKNGTGNFATAAFSLGRRTDGSIPGPVKVRRLAIFAGALSTEDRASLTAWLGG